MVVTKRKLLLMGAVFGVIASTLALTLTSIRVFINAFGVPLNLPLKECSCYRYYYRGRLLETAYRGDDLFAAVEAGLRSPAIGPRDSSGTTISARLELVGSDGRLLADLPVDGGLVRFNGELYLFHDANFEDLFSARHSRRIYWHDNGTRRAKGTHNLGDKIGWWDFYYDTGKLNACGFFEKGEPVGPWSFWDASGDFVTDWFFEPPNG